MGGSTIGRCRVGVLYGAIGWWRYRVVVLYVALGRRRYGCYMVVAP